MKTRKQILQSAKKEKIWSKCLDGRDFARLCEFFPVEDWPTLGMKLREDVDPRNIKTVDWTEENIKKQLEQDVAFAFKKALNKRGISSSFMFETIKMWMWVLDDSLQDFDSYSMYGLPLYKAVAVKYGFPNPIGDDTGSEASYNESRDYD